MNVAWRGFQLHPEIPPGGAPVARLFGERRAAKMGGYLANFAREFGVEIAAPPLIPNTLRALAVTEFARDEGRLETFRDATMDAHWLHGKDIESDGDLADLALAAGLDPGQALVAADDPAYRKRLAAARADALDRNVTAIPTFMFGEYPVVGCQRFDTLALVADKMGVPRRDKHT